MEGVKRALVKLPPDFCIPFRLKYYTSLGPLAPEEEQWVARRSGLTQDAIASIVEQEFESNREQAFPLSSEFIGELMGIPPALSGKNTTVDQRISRARARLNEMLGEDDE